MNQHLILLHGALGSKAQFKNLCDLLSPNLKIHSLNFSGHGEKWTSLGKNLKIG